MSPSKTPNESSWYHEPEMSQILGRDKLMPIAVIGMACRFPGDATSPEALWEMLARKKSGLVEIPKSRFNIDAFYHPDPDRNGTFNVRKAHFVKDDIAAFDAPFFSVSPAEAKAMDPQQRMVLESAYEALENAGVPMEDVAGSNTSCYVGCFSRDYNELLARDPETAPVYVSTGNGAAILSNRVSYFFDMKGPSLTVDTACSSSLVALHLACQSLRNGESKMSIVGGTNLIFSPDVMIAMSNVHFLGPDSKCYTYDNRSNGYSRGEGIAAIILKPLEDAVRDNDTIRAVIRGTFCNQDGRTAGIMLPSRQAQEELITMAYNESGCDPAAVGYFEAHGTGTPAGDPLEAGAIGSTLAKYRQEGDHGKLYVGSVKTNLGHLEGASGLASFIKTVLSLERGVILPNLWFEKGNERIDFEGWRIKVPTELIPWPMRGVRRASINSFGFGGTNAHVILDDAYHYLKSRGLKAAHRTSRKPLLLEDEPISNGNAYIDSSSSSSSIGSDDGYGSGHHTPVSSIGVPPKDRYRIFKWATHEEGVAKNNAQAYANALETRKEIDEGIFLNDLAYTLQRRSQLPLKCHIIAKSVNDLVTKLRSSRQKPIRTDKQAPRIAFVFTGQGAQWWGMGRELISIYPIFAESIHEADKAVSSFGAPWSLVEELTKDKANSRVNEALISQPLCTAVQLALVDLYASWGVSPQRVIGHSSGEIAAAYACGALPFTSAMKVSYYRGLLSSQVKDISKEPGAMLAAGLGVKDAEERVKTLDSNFGKAVVACINSPSNVTISGDESAIDEIKNALDKDKIFTRKLMVDAAYHSHHMQLVSQQYLDTLAGLEVRPPDQRRSVEMISTVTGMDAGYESFDASYWVRNMVSPVRFADGLASLCTVAKSGRSQRLRNKATVDILVEIGPHSALAGPIKQILVVPALQKSGIAYQSALVRGQDACETALEVAAVLHSKGCPVDIEKVNFPGEEHLKPQVLVDLPSYPWNHNKKFWAESRLSEDYLHRKVPRNDFLGAPTVDWNPIEPRWRNFIRIGEQPWVRDHQVQESIVYPGAGYICMALEAARQMVLPSDVDRVVGFTIQELIISRALVVPQAETGIETIFSLRPFNTCSKSSSDKWNEFRLFSWREDGWSEHCRGLISTKYIHTTSEVDAGTEEREALKKYQQELETAACVCTTKTSPDTVYEDLSKAGLDYGPTFRNLIEVSHGSGQAFGMLQIPDTKSVMPYQYEHDHLLHPATMDTFLQILFPALIDVATNVKEPYMPTFVQELYVSSKISNVPGQKFRALSKAAFVGFREAAATVHVFDEDSPEPVLRIEGVKCTALTSSGGSDDDDLSESKKLCFDPLWEPDLEFLDKPQMEQVLCTGGAEDTPSEYIAQLEMVAHYFYEQVIRNIKDEEVNSMSSHHQKYFRYMQHQHDLVKQGKVEHQNEDWLRFDEPEVQEKMQQLIARIEGTDHEGQLLCRMGNRLTSVLRQEVDPLALMLDGGLLYDYYANSLGIATSYSQLARYITLMSNKNPDLEFLEIGAGTGGATVPILGALGGSKGTYPRFKSYTYTDISSGFFEKAEEKFKEWKGLIDFRKLDVETDPDKQGFEGKQFDVIMAFNVLHATKDIKNTLENTRKLLKPGGKLLLLEITHVLNRVFLPFGCLPGWWLSEESYRQWGPTMTEEKWTEVLRETRFGPLLSSTPDHQNPRDQTGRLMITEAIESLPIGETPQERPSSIILVHSGNTFQSQPLIDELQTELAANQINVSTCSFAGLAELEIANKVIVSFAELDQPLLRDISSQDFGTLKRILHESSGLLWLTKGACQEAARPDLALMHGLARTLRAEHEGFPLVSFDYSAENPLPPTQAVSLLMKVFRSVYMERKSTDFEYSERHGLLFIKRCVEAASLNSQIAGQTNTDRRAPEPQPFYQPGRPLTLAIETPGLLDTLVFKDDYVASQSVAPDYVEIEVKAAGLNFRDIMVSMGQLVDDFLGCECSGVVTRVGTEVTRLKIGDRVTTWTLGAYCNYLHNPAALVQRIPDSMPYHVAASLPIVYCTAYYGLIYMARLVKGESVLIHAAAGGVGQAAIMLCKLFDAEIYVTVGTKEKKEHIMKTYNIPEDHIFSSRDLSFAEGIKRMTGGKGVDVVLNCLAGEALKATWKCIATFGRFVEIGKKDIEDNTRLDMAPFIRNVVFASVDLTVIFRHRKALGAELLSEVMKLLHNGDIGEVSPIKVFSFSQIEEAFRYMQAGKHMGKIILEPKADDIVPVVPRPDQGLQFKANASYLIVGGFGGLGRSMARWMQTRGAKNLIMLSRSGGGSEAAQTLIKELSELGVRVEPVACDIINEDELKTGLAKIRETMPPIRGVIQAAMHLEDRIFDNMPLDVFHKVVRPKVHGTWNLHQATLSQPLDFFVMLASAAGMVGDTSQGNYAAANAFQDALAHYRVARGLPATTIDLGMVRSVGYVAENQGAAERNLARWGFLQIEEAEFLAMLEIAMTGKQVQIVTGVGTQAHFDRSEGEIPHWFREPSFSHLHKMRARVVESDKNAGPSISQRLKESTSLTEGAAVVLEAVLTKLSKSLMIPMEELDASAPTSVYGVDSLVAVEIRNWLGREMKADVPVFEILQASSLQSLSYKIAEKNGPRVP
ncbi:uncharacterized protein BDR25DRAFT_341828 [Lindgomyces ingoldianus]|uniref:Uncharacterized protein n=1 Tax=Lindgomyces ingoldianus TaxID=673940 RepID=A0ACB6R236_9PLEO|nr:uncharacterized protein BDR25DRAFT_341828 [Lindgomyces ingoldianus]KAF2472400.1 hypothetical protein BDR25DRAFT_341828 [Lindgomyces ingoldianus]